MKLTKAEYEELIRKKPSLRPTEKAFIHKKVEESFLIPALSPSEIIKSQNTHTTIVGGPYEFGEPIGQKVTIVPQRSFVRPPTLIFTIPGQPVGKPRMTQADKFIKRPRVMKYWAWAEKARSSVPQGVELAIYREVHFKAYLGFPKSYSERRRKLLTGNPHLLRGDADNFLKAIQDSLFKEDGCIWKFSGEKRWDDNLGPRIEVELR